MPPFNAVFAENPQQLL